VAAAGSAATGARQPVAALTRPTPCDQAFRVQAVRWPGYLAPWIDGLVPGTAQQAMYAVGVIEVVAGIAVAVAPRFGAWLVAAWLVGIIVNLLTFPGFFDIALRDFGLLIGAVALARLATRYAPGWRTS